MGVAGYLKKSLLSDERFARARLNMRKIAHSEGRIKLERELYSRGKSKNLAASVLDEFFAENPEDALCRRAYEKCRRLRKSDEKTVNRLLACGFPYKLVKQIMKEAEDGSALPPEGLYSHHQEQISFNLVDYIINRLFIA